jgi:broad specificity phosphatase PhoE
MLLYLRHGDDRGNDEYRHDRRLNDRGREKASKVAKRLVEKYGCPDVVLVSPFRRALETVEAMKERFEQPVTIHSDARIAQYVGNKIDPKISPETATWVSVTEDQAAFRQRIAAHVTDVRYANGAIWCVTHQVVIEEIAEHFGVKISDDLDFLDHVVMLS